MIQSKETGSFPAESRWYLTFFPSLYRLRDLKNNSELSSFALGCNIEKFIHVRKLWMKVFSALAAHENPEVLK